MTQAEKPFPKTRTNCVLCSGREPTDGEHAPNKDHLSSNVTAVFWFGANACEASEQVGKITKSSLSLIAFGVCK